jgi:2-polyprenyl-6-methoxyphenol hydroxylase-like FAD-dependent oxidoreductase
MKKEITIIGAGSTGLSAAIFLHEKGHKVRIFEKRERATITKAIGINPVTLKIFEKTGISQRFITNGWKLETSNIYYRDKLVYKNHFSKVRHPYPFMIIQPQYETENILEEYLNERGIFVERKFELDSLQSKENSINLGFKNSKFADYNFNTDGFVLGTDGSKSKVRELAGIKMNGWEHDAVFTLYDIELETNLPPNELHYIFLTEGAILMLRIKDNIWRIGGNLPNLLEMLPKGTKTGKISWETKFTIREMVSEKLNHHNIFVLGDAAHVHSPLGGRGMNLCIEDSYLFTEFLSNNKLNNFSKFRLRELNKTVGVLGKLTEVIGGNHIVGNLLRSQMGNFSFMFPLFMPYMRKFLLGLK